MASLPAVPPAANDKPPSPLPVPAPLPPDGHKTIIGHGILFAVPILLGFLMFIFLGIPAVMLPEFKLDLGSSLSSPIISTSHITARWNIALSIKNLSKLIAVKYTHMKLLLSFSGELSLCRPSHIPTFTQGPCNFTAPNNSEDGSDWMVLGGTLRGWRSLGDRQADAIWRGFML